GGVRKIDAAGRAAGRGRGRNRFRCDLGRVVTVAYQPRLEFTAPDAAAADGDPLIIDIDGYEGPLDLLLALARTQKVDLLKLSVAKLADQYLAFVRQARRQHFSLAADYLVMAAWLAFLKSRLLLPKAERPA